MAKEENLILKPTSFKATQYPELITKRTRTRRPKEFLQEPYGVLDSIGSVDPIRAGPPIPLTANRNLSSNETLDQQNHQIIFQKVGEYATVAEFHHVHIPVLFEFSFKS